MAIMLCLLFTAIVHFTKGCSTDKDGDLRQTVANYSDCTCREYQDTYATCYDLLTCKRFPRDFQTRLKCFKLQTTLIEKISAGDFTNLSHVTSMYIDVNQYLLDIEPGAFKELRNLTQLTISYNPNLTNLEEDTFVGLDNLETLNLIGNGFTTFKSFTASLKAKFLPKLKTLNFKELKCSQVYQDDFKYLKGGRVINVAFDGSLIDYIHPDALIALRTLQNLSVSETLITEQNLIDVLERIIERNLPLTSLSMNGWGFKTRVPEKLFNVIANSTIRTLFLNKNMFHIIDEKTFIRMPNVESLYLEQNMIIDVNINALSNFPNLKELHLQQNKLISIPDGVKISTLKVLDISSNTELGSSYFTIEENLLKLSSSLEVLILSNNNLRSIFEKTFKGSVRLKRFYLHNCNIVRIADYAFSDMFNLEHLDLSKNRFPQRTFSKDIFKGLGNLKYLSLQSCKIDHFPREDIFGYLTSLETLNLDDNSLTEITPHFMEALKTLKALSFRDNKIKIWNERLLKHTKLENLTVSGNTLTHLTGAMLVDFNDLKTFDVSGNPFHCDCDTFVEPFNFLNRTQIDHILNVINKTSTFCLLPVESENTTVVNYYLDSHKRCDQDKTKQLINWLIPFLICLICILILGGLSYAYRWHIRYWIFLTKVAISKQTQFKKRVNVQGHTNYLYDAFVSYSTEDRNFVIRLVGMLENYEPFLKLCVYERDFEIGTMISESVLESLSRSRKTLLIVSDSYIKSQWCIWEAQVAENHRLFFENENGECVNDSLILIKLGNISSKNISPMLRYLMKTRIYLQWDPAEGKEKVFWEKLRNALAPAYYCAEKESTDTNM